MPYDINNLFLQKDVVNVCSDTSIYFIVTEVDMFRNDELYSSKNSML